VKCGQNHGPAAVPSEKRASTTPIWDGCAPRPVWMVWGKSLSPIGIRSPDLATCSEWPYRLSCRGLLLQKELNCVVFSASSFVVIFFPWIRILSSPEKWERRREGCVCLVVNAERKRTLGRPRRKWEYNIKMMWTELIWLWIGTIKNLLQTRWWNLGFYKMQSVAWMAGETLNFSRRYFLHGVSYIWVEQLVSGRYSKVHRCRLIWNICCFGKIIYLSLSAKYWGYWACTTAECDARQDAGRRLPWH
jgi:hypothetical protein